jgi:MFS family permease
LISYYSHDVYDSIGITDADTQLGLNGGITTMSLFISVGCAFLIDKIGRRPLFLVATVSMLVCFVAWTICSARFEINGSDAAGRAVVAFIWLFNAAYALAWSGLLVAYTVEILPFKIRAKGKFFLPLRSADVTFEEVYLAVGHIH